MLCSRPSFRCKLESSPSPPVSGCRITSGMTTAYWHMAHQDRSSWTTEIDVRPFKEKF